MLTVYPVWDISYDVAAVFTLGSIVWVINAFFSWLPLVRPDTEFKNEILYGGGIIAFIGATIFVVSSILLMLEAVNENRSGLFRVGVEHIHRDAGEASEDEVRLRPSKSVCTHHHLNKRNLVGKGKAQETLESPTNRSKSWVW